MASTSPHLIFVGTRKERAASGGAELRMEEPNKLYSEILFYKEFK